MHRGLQTFLVPEVDRVSEEEEAGLLEKVVRMRFFSIDAALI